jgi:hypothetical protein
LQDKTGIGRDASTLLLAGILTRRKLYGKQMGYTLHFDGQHLHEQYRQAAIALIDAAISEGHSVLEIICSEDAEPLTVGDVLDWREVKADHSPPPKLSN